MSEEIKKLITQAEIDKAVQEALERGLDIEKAISEGKQERNKIMNMHLLLIGLLLVAGGVIIWDALEDGKIVTSCQIWFRESPFYFNPDGTFDIDIMEFQFNESYRDQWNEIKYKSE